MEAYGMKRKKKKERVLKVIKEACIRKPPLLRIGLTLGAFIVYTLAFLLLYTFAGGGIIILVIIPVIAAGCNFGLWGGIVAAIFAVPLDTLLMRFAGVSATEMALRLRAFPFSFALLITIGAAFGRLSDIRGRLKEQNSFLNHILKAIAHPLYCIDVNDYTIKMANPTARKQGKVEGRTCYETTHRLSTPCFHSGYPCPIEEIRKTGKPVTMELIHCCADGSVRNVVVHGYPLFNEKGDLTQIIEYNIDITRNKELERELAESEIRYRCLVEQSLTGIFVIQEEKFTYVNPGFAKIFGYNQQEMLELPSAFDLFVGEDVERSRKNIRKCITGEKEFCLGTYRGSHHSGKILDLEFYVRKIVIGTDSAIMGTVIDITERKQAERKLKASLKEKEVLLKEIHHRVKNNLQVISSMLSLQSSYIKNKKNVVSFLQDCQSRVHSMALVHDLLYKSEDFPRININRYIENLVSYILDSYDVFTGRIRMRKKAEEIELDLDTAIPVGLILTELVSNSIKHAFPEGEEGEIEIKLFKETAGNIILEVRDNGVGLPGELDIEKTGRFGLELVDVLIKKLQGSAYLNTEEGTWWKISFPLQFQQGNIG
ncbi:MAG: hypothetical protein DRP87_17645, partial [Spirochaetes bacterium]